MEEIIRKGSLRFLTTDSTCDVILSCPEYKLMAHKIILSIASPLLRELLREDPSQISMLIFPEVKPPTLTLILDYIYNGHVSIYKNEIEEFISFAKLLKLHLDENCLEILKSDHDLKLMETPKFKKIIPGLIPISHRKSLFNKVFPSPWTRNLQIYEDPRSSHGSVTDSGVKSDANNNVELSERIGSECEEEIVNKDKKLSCETEKLKATISKEKPFKCDDCGKSFSQLRNYKYHRSIHDGTKEFSTKCPECGKVFNDRGYLSSHMKIHRDRKEYACQHCPKRFNQRVAYNMHLRIHTGIKPHECSDCGKSFSRKMLLKQHQRVHTGERPYKCTECGKSFADRSNMSLHARLHTGVKPYSCTICSKSFTKKHHLKTHMNFHTGLKPYSCQKCGLSFSQSSNMRTHYKKCIVKQEDNICDLTKQ